MSTKITYPYTLQNSTIADADEVMDDFNEARTRVNDLIDDVAGPTQVLTQTLTNKKVSTGCALDALADGNFTYYGMARQAIINGNFDVWQRGTSIAMTAADAYASDRWYCETATAATDKTVSRQDGTGVNGSYYCARVAMVQDTDELLTFSQALESQDSIKFRGKKATLSFYARGGAEFVSNNATLVSKIVEGKGTDQKVLAFTTSADGISQNNTLTTSWVKFTCTTTNVEASDITQIGISFSFTHAGSGTTTNYFEVAQVQLCAGDVALPFLPKSYEEELRLCQRYCEKIGGESGQVYVRFTTGHNRLTTSNSGVYFFKVTKRTTSFTLSTSGNASDYAIYQADSVITCSAIPKRQADDVGQQSLQCVAIETTVASGLTVGQGSELISNNNSNAYLLFNNEF
jgi:hypothetical protein